MFVQCRCVSSLTELFTRALHYHSTSHNTYVQNPVSTTGQLDTLQLDSHLIFTCRDVKWLEGKTILNIGGSLCEVKLKFST